MYNLPDSDYLKQLWTDGGRRRTGKDINLLKSYYAECLPLTGLSLMVGLDTHR